MGSFRSVNGATPQYITELMEAKGPVGLTLDLTTPLSYLGDVSFLIFWISRIHHEFTWQ